MRNPRPAAAIALAASTLLLVAPGCHSLRKQPPAEHKSAQLLDAPPENGGKVSHRQAADVQVALGRSLEAEGQAAQAEDAYRRALANNPKRADAHDRLAVLADLKGDFAAADKAYAEAIRLDPRNADWRCDRGYHFAIQRRWAEAESDYREAIKLDAGHARSHNNLGMVLAHRGDEDGAVAEFARAGLDPADARTNLGLILASEGQLPEAEKAYAAAVRLKPASAAAQDGHRAVLAARNGPAPKLDPAARAVAAKAPIVDPAVRQTALELPPLP